VRGGHCEVRSWDLRIGVQQEVLNNNSSSNTTKTFFINNMTQTTKVISFTDKSGIRKYVLTVFKGKNENNTPIVYPKGLSVGDYTRYWLAIQEQYGQVCIRTGYRLNQL
jgi:hypothetical protein